MSNIILKNLWLEIKQAISKIAYEGFNYLRTYF